MTNLFQTDNIFYVPANQPFRIYDLMDWRRIDLHTHSLQAFLRNEAFDAVHARAHKALEGIELLDDADRREQQERMHDFLQNLHLTPGNQAFSSEIQNALLPMRAIFWVRLSQQPMESFFTEDYEEWPEARPDAPVLLRTIGAVTFNSFGETECDLPSENPHSFELTARAGEEVVSFVPLAPDDPLPLLREYCGFKGSSNQGEMVTIDLNAAIPEVSMAAIPMRREGEGHFETLYLHLETGVGEDSPLFPFRADQERRIAESLKTAGFTPTKRSRRFAVFERGLDTIQLYRDLEGKESEDVPVLPSFCLATQANGSSDWEGRVALLQAVFL